MFEKSWKNFPFPLPHYNVFCLRQLVDKLRNLRKLWEILTFLSHRTCPPLLSSGSATRTFLLSSYVQLWIKMMGNGLPFCHFTFIFFNVSRFHVAVVVQLLIVHRQMCIKGENGKCFALRLASRLFSCWVVRVYFWGVVVYLFDFHSLFGHGYKNWICICTRPPVISGESWHISQSVRVEIFLEELRFTWHYERNHLTETVVVDPVKSGNFARRDITASFRNHSNASLRIRGLEGIDVVNKWWLGSDLKVPDHTVTLEIRNYNKQHLKQKLRV